MKIPKKIKKALFSLVLTMTVSVSNIPMSFAQKSNEPKGYVTITAEKFTLGLGYLQEPIKVPFYEGDTYADITIRALGKDNLKYEYSTYGFYLSGIKDDDTREPNVPQYILDQGVDIGGREYEEWLKEFDYTSMSGWMYAVDNDFPDVGAGNLSPKDGDVCRWQFTIHGLGMDLGEDGFGMGEPYIDVADRDDLTEEVAEINSSENKNSLLKDTEIKEAYEEAYKVLEDLTSTQDEVDNAYEKLNEAVDGLKPDTYLYRVTHGDVAYYTPNTPEEYRDTEYEPDINKKNYRKWGPWEMAKNKVNFSADSNLFYGKEVIIKKGAKIEGSTSTNASQTLDDETDKAIKVLPRAYTKYSKAYIYFSLKGTPYNGKTTDNIGRVLLSDVDAGEDYKPASIFRSAVKVDGGYDYVPKNFSILGNYKDSTDSSHVNLEKGRWKNPSYAPDSVKNKTGEWSHIGYNSKGEPIMNPYFPSTSLHYLGCAEPKNYDWKTNPFGRNNTFDGAAYADDRYELMESLFENGVFDYTGTSASQKKNDINRQIEKFSFSTHPTKDTAILLGQRSIGTHKRELAVLNPPGDLYLASLKVYDNGTEIASYTYDISTGKRTRKNASDVVPGKEYTVKVKLGNAKNRKILATKNQATIGITKEKKFLNLKTVNEKQLSNVLNNQSSSNGIGPKIGNLSSNITFNIKAPTDCQVFDIYGLVGNNHDGTDNMDYTNDAGFVRMYTEDAFREGEVIVKKANLKAASIELLDTSNNSVVYSSTGNIVNTAIIPGKSYKIRYNIKNDGDRPTVVTYRAGYEDSDGTWHSGTSTTSYPTVKVLISYTNTLKVNNSDGNVVDFSASGSNKKITVNGSEDISLTAGGTYSYTTEAIYFANPYLNSRFTVSTDKSIGNSDTTDDTASTTINDLYDAVISDVKIYPAYEYVSSGERHAIFNITYKAKINAATHIKNVGNISSKVNTLITVGDRTLPFKDVLIANNEWQEFSHTLEKVTLKNDTTGVKAVVTLNYDRKMHETNFDNNTGQSSSNVVKVVANPFDGSNSDKVSRIDTSNGASLNGGGVLNNNCLIPRRSNSWTMSHRKHSWSNSTKTYTINNHTYHDEVYTTSSQSTVNKSYTESFEIKKVEFKSKETEGKGTDGWINLLMSNQADLAKVKAGYGFELRIVTEYRTDATRTQPIGNSTTKYTGIIGDNDPGHAWNKGINYSDELFVELPGTEGVHGTRKILSTTGYTGTTNGLVISEKDLSTSSEVVKEFTYTIKPSNTLGISQVGKIFIPTGLKDGKYKISIYTPPISGAISNGKNKYTSLCDRRDVYINVSGSYTDDLNSNIIQ